MTALNRWYWVDGDGDRSVTTTFSTNLAATEGATGNAIRDAMIGISEAELLKVGITSGYTVASPGSPEDGPYATEAEALVLVFESTTTRKKFEYRVNAPDESLFAVDDDHVVATDADSDGIPDAIDSAVTTLLANIKGPHGEALSFVRAYRGRLNLRAE